MMEMRLRRGVLASEIDNRWDMLALYELLAEQHKPEYCALVGNWRWLMRKGLMPAELLFWRVALDCGFDLDNNAEEEALMVANLRASDCEPMAQLWKEDRAQFEALMAAGREYWPQNIARWN